jgi:Methyltransferase domain
LRKKIARAYAQDASLASPTTSKRDPLTPVFRRSMFWRPERQTQSPWIEHVPFAFWLVDVLRPRTVVELGTNPGVSYSAICQAVKRLDLATSCFAVDTWKGDAQSGFYVKDAYYHFAAFHDQRYGTFSRLIRSTFDEALCHFDDGFIDLLHIDGLDTYEDVKHDYETWLPKLSSNAVVLFHNTSTRHNNDSTFRFWSEATQGKLHFQFLHGQGLGILGLGRHYPSALRLLFKANEDGHLVNSLRETFALLGHSVRVSSERSSLDQLIAERNSEIDALRHALARREDELAQFAAKNKHARTLDEQLEAINERARIAETERAVAVDDAAMVRKIALEQFAAVEERINVANARSNLDRARADAAEAAMKAAESRSSLDRARADAVEAAMKAAESRSSLDRARADAAEAAVASMRSIISALHASTSWHMTAPLRSAKLLLIRLHCINVSCFLAQLWRAVRSWSPAPLRDWRDARIVARSPYFDGSWYLVNNPDVAEAGVDPALHYATRGWREGRNPGPAFDTRHYLAHNRDVERARVNPLTHYMRRGETETCAGGVLRTATKDIPPSNIQSSRNARAILDGSIVGSLDGSDA